jgi:hypothetical protein
MRERRPIDARLRNRRGTSVDTHHRRLGVEFLLREIPRDKPPAGWSFFIKSESQPAGLCAGLPPGPPVSARSSGCNLVSSTGLLSWAGVRRDSAVSSVRRQGLTADTQKMNRAAPPSQSGGQIPPERPAKHLPANFDKCQNNQAKWPRARPLWESSREPR